jgi:serine-type D-Ala-D-Ala carboxypeptidase (penicillin-binding protein 5/6)
MEVIALKQIINKKYIISLVSILVLSFLLSPFTSPAKGAGVQLDLQSKAAFLLDATTGKILYEKNPDEALPIASMTKMMTEYLVLEAIDQGKIEWDTTTKITQYAYDISADDSFSGVGLKLAHDYTVRELYDAMAINSDNATTITLAELIAGSEAEFVKMMNEKAVELELPNAKFVNSTGLSNSDLGDNYPQGTGPNDENILSARSVGLLAYSLLRDFPEVLETSSIAEQDFYGERMINWNHMLPDIPGYLQKFAYPGVDGLKTGWTPQAGACFTGTAVQNGMRLISVVMSAPTKPERFEETKKLFDYGFNNFKEVELFPEGYQLKGETTLPVVKGKEKSVEIMTNQPIKAVISYDDEENNLFEPTYVYAEKKVTKDGELTAPIKQEEAVGYMTVTYKGENNYGFITPEGADSIKADLVVKSEVEKANWFVLMMRGIGGFFGDIWGSISGTVKGWF